MVKCSLLCSSLFADSDLMKGKHVDHKIAFGHTKKRNHTKSSGHATFGKNLTIFCGNNKDSNRKESKHNAFLVLDKRSSEVDEVQGEPELELKIKLLV